MKRQFPSLFAKLTLWDHDPTSRQGLEEDLRDLCEELEQIVPEEAKECLLYALMLVEEGFKTSVFVHSATVKR